MHPCPASKSDIVVNLLTWERNSQYVCTAFPVFCYLQRPTSIGPLAISFPLVHIPHFNNVFLYLCVGIIPDVPHYVEQGKGGILKQLTV